MSTVSQMHEFQTVTDEVHAMRNAGFASNRNEGATRNVRVNLGIDEDLRMILEMDPSIIDLGNASLQDYGPPNQVDIIRGLPPKSGGYVGWSSSSSALFIHC